MPGVAVRVLLGLLMVAPVFGATACNALLGIDSKPVDDGRFDPISSDDGGRDTPADSGFVPGDGSLVDRDSGIDGGDGKIDCLGARRNAFFCDGFESVIDAPWQKILLPDARANVSISTSKHVAGAQGMTSAFSTLPPSGAAKVHYPRPGGAGPLSLQVSIYVDDDAWNAGEAVPLGGLRAGASGVAVLYFVANGTNGNGKIELRVNNGSLNTLNLGAATINAFSCYEIAYDGTNVSAFAGTASKGTLPLAAAVDAAEVGIEWSLGANAGAGKVMHFDDVVIAPVPVGCLH